MLNRWTSTSRAAPLTHYAVDFIDEYCAWLVKSGKLKENSDQLLTLTSPFWNNWRSRNVKKSGLALCRYRLRQQCLHQKDWYLPSPRWSKQEHSSPRLQNARKIVRILEWQHNCLLNKSLSIIKTDDISELDIRVLNKDIPEQVGSKFSVLRNVRVIWNSFQYSDVESLIVLFLVLFLSVFCWDLVYMQIITPFPVI